MNKYDIGILILIFIATLSIPIFLLANIGMPARGSAYGYIYFQEISGIWQRDKVCWKDTPYIEECEWFNPEKGVKYIPGKYEINYTCEMFAWYWEKASVCTITGATKLEETK